MPSRRVFRDRILQDARAGSGGSSSLTQQILELSGASTVNADMAFPVLDVAAMGTVRATAAQIRDFVLGISGGVVNVPEATAFGGAVSIVGQLNLTGAAIFSSTLAVTSNATVGGTLGVTGAVTGGTYNSQTISAVASFTGTIAAVGTVTAPTFVGALTGNASTATNVAWGGITSTPTTIAGYGITDFNSLGDARWTLYNGTGATGTWGISITGSAASSTGNAATATILQTTRTIWGQNFNGSANVSGALSGATTGAFSSSVTVGGTLTVSGILYAYSGASTVANFRNGAGVVNSREWSIRIDGPTGQLSLRSVLDNNTTVAQALSIVHATGAATFSSSLTLGGALAGATTGAFSSNVTVGGTLGVTGAVTGGTYNSQTISSAASLTGTLGVTGQTTLAGILRVTHAETQLGSTTGNGAVRVVGAAGSVSTLRFNTATTADSGARWILQRGTGTESGANAGSSLELYARTDAGASIDSTLVITRAAGGAIAFSSARPITGGTYNGQTISSAADFTGTLRFLGYVPTDVDTHNTSASRQFAPFATGFQPTNRPSSGNYFTGFSLRHNLSGTYVTQFAFGATDVDAFNYRYYNNTSWSAWRTVLSSQNYNNYSPTLTGTGASGSWGISVTGSSASTTGNASTATILATTRTIWGQAFNGSANVTGAMSGVTTLAASSTVTLTTSGAALTASNAASYLTVGGAASSNVKLYLRGSLGSSVTAYGVYANNSYGSSVTQAYSGLRVAVSTEDAIFTTPNHYGIIVDNPTKGAQHTITNVYGLYITHPTAGATSNWSIYTTGQVRFGGNATVSTGGITVTGNSTITGTLAVSGQSLMGTTAHATGSPRMTLGGGTIQLVLAEGVANATNKNARFGAAHYTNAEEPVHLLSLQSSVSASTLYIGGGFTTTMNAVTSVGIYTAANNTTQSVSATLRASWSSSGVMTQTANLTVSAGGITVTGNSTIAGTLGGITTLGLSGLMTFTTTNANSIMITRTSSATNSSIAFGTTSGTVYVGQGAANTFAIRNTADLAGVPWFTVSASAVTAASFVGALTGNATTATSATSATSAATLTTPRTLWGQSFNGSADVSGQIQLSNSGTVMGYVHGIAWAGSVTLLNNLTYVSGNVTAAGAYTYIGTATSTGATTRAGSVLLIEANTNRLSWRVAPTSTGAGDVPVSLTSMFSVSSIGTFSVSGAGTFGGALTVAGAVTGVTTLAASSNVTIGGTGLIGLSAHAAGSPRLTVGGGTMALVIAEHLNDATDKHNRFGAAHYTNAQEPTAIAMASNSVSSNVLSIGGGSSALNAATTVQIYTAANNTTTTGTVRASWNSAGLFNQVGAATIGGTLSVSGVLTASAGVTISASGSRTTGYSASWGVVTNVTTVGPSVVMGTGASATWLIAGTSSGTFRAGIQALDAGGTIRHYIGANYNEQSAGAGTTISIANLGTVTAAGGTLGSLTVSGALSAGSAGVTGALSVGSGLTTNTISILSGGTLTYATAAAGGAHSFTGNGGSMFTMAVADNTSHLAFVVTTGGIAVTGNSTITGTLGVTGNATFSAAGSPIRLNDAVSGTDATTSVWLSFHRAAVEKGWIGFGDGASGIFRVWNTLGNLRLGTAAASTVALATSGTDRFTISGANAVLTGELAIGGAAIVGSGRLFVAGTTSTASTFSRVVAQTAGQAWYEVLVSGFASLFYGVNNSGGTVNGIATAWAGMTTGAGLQFATADVMRMQIDTSGVVRVVNLAGSGTRLVGADGSGNLVITTAAGDVVGPGSATDNAIARYNGTTGKTVQGSSVIIDDSNNITGVVALTATGIIRSGASGFNVNGNAGVSAGPLDAVDYSLTFVGGILTDATLIA